MIPEKDESASNVIRADFTKGRRPPPGETSKPGFIDYAWLAFLIISFITILVFHWNLAERLHDK